MTSEYFTGLLDYDNMMNREVLELLRGLPSVSEKTESIFVHILAAKRIWIKRLRGEDWSGVAVWPTLSLDDCEALLEENRNAFQTFLRGKSQADLKTKTRYRNSKGIEFENPVQDVLMHVLIHSGYHRGQIAKAVREAGEEPINTDYIMHIREQVSDTTTEIPSTP